MIPSLEHLTREDAAVKIPTPKGWHYEKKHKFRGSRSASVYSRIDSVLTVLLSIATMDNGKRFVHCNLSKTPRLPSKEEVEFVKDSFLNGKDTVQVLQKKGIHIFAPHNDEPVERKSDGWFSRAMKAARDEQCKK